MYSILIPEKDIPDFDGEISGQFTLELVTVEVIKRERMRIGFRNQHGDIYRAIGVTGVHDFTDTVSKLLQIGFVDELQNHDGPRQGFDAIFIK